MIASHADIRKLRLQNHRLASATFARPEQVVRWFCAVQAQDYAGAKWGIAQRTARATNADLDRLFDAGAILRTHVMRPTWHFVLPEDIRWLLAATAPRVHAANAHYYRKVGLDGAMFARSDEIFVKALSSGQQLTREELAAALRAGGVACEDTLRFTYLVIHAELDGVLCSGARRGKQFTYALLDDRVPAGGKLARGEALGQLTGRYFASHGPATAADCAWWSGLTAADVKTGIEAANPRLERAAIDGKTYWFAARPPKARAADGPLVHLLPNFDEYVVAYQNRQAFLEPKIAKKLDPRSGVFATNALVVNGLLAGGWRRTVGKGEVVLEKKPLSPLNAAQKKALREAAERYARFLGLDLVLRPR